MVTVGVRWFTGRSVVGIAVKYDEITKEGKSYIAPVPGFDYDVDVKFILEWGTKFPIKDALRLIRDGDIKDLTLYRKLCDKYDITKETNN